jgi:hypothetical protein
MSNRPVSWTASHRERLDAANRDLAVTGEACRVDLPSLRSALTQL